MIFDVFVMLSRIESHFGQKPTRYKKVTVGLTNTVYEFECNNRKFIYKEYSNDSEVEKSVLKILKIPKVLVNEEKYRIEEFIEHSKIDYVRNIKEIANAVRNFHSINFHSFFKIQSFEELLEKLILKANKNKCKMFFTIKKRLLSLIKHNSLKTALCHNDIHLGNLLNTPEKVYIIDFEFSAIGEVLCDIANLFCETQIDYANNQFKEGFTVEEERKFLMHYFGEIGELEEIHLKVEKLKIVSHFVWILWVIPKLKVSKELVWYALGRLVQLKASGFLTSQEYESIYEQFK